MAQIENNKKTIRMDMTPLVDLAFLLLTFFVLTSTLTKQQAIDLTFPPKCIDCPITPANGMTILFKRDKLYYAVGDYIKNPTKIIASKDIIKELTLTKKAFNKMDKELNIVVMPDDSTSYESVISVIDALNITDNHRFVIQNVNPSSSLVMRNTR
jgi:biopolymer transport protein ExbD